MNLSPPLDQLSLDEVSASVSAAARCEVANFRWELAIEDARSAEYHTFADEVGSHKDWKAAHKSYLNSSVHVAKDLPRSSECFMVINGRAHLNENLDNTFLLRLESMDNLLHKSLISEVAQNFWWRFFKSQKDLRKEKLSDSDEALRTDFVMQWNAHRTQARPLFATFLNDFGGDLEALVKDDWPHLLRDRLGLTHFSSVAGAPMAVALMCYTVEEVRQARLMNVKKGAAASFTRPTVLDAEMSSAFIPAPLFSGGESYGYTLDLGVDEVPESFAPELLTFPIEYQARHIKALGFISTQHALQEDENILKARNYHVQGLRRLPDCENFGEVLT